MADGPTISLTPRKITAELPEEVKPDSANLTSPTSEVSIMKVEVSQIPVLQPQTELTALTTPRPDLVKSIINFQKLNQEDRNTANSTSFKEFLSHMDRYRFPIASNGHALLELFKNPDSKLFKVLSSEQGLAAAKSTGILGTRFENLKDFQALDTLLATTGPNSSWDTVSPEFFQSRANAIAKQQLEIRNSMPEKHPLNSRWVNSMNNATSEFKETFANGGVTGLAGKYSSPMKYLHDTFNSISRELLPAAISPDEMILAASKSETGRLDFNQLLNKDTHKAIIRTLASTGQDHHPTIMAMLEFDSEVLQPLAQVGIKRAYIPRLTNLLDSMQSSILGMDPEGLGNSEAGHILSVIENPEFISFAANRIPTDFKIQPLESFKQLAQLAIEFNSQKTSSK